MIKYLEAGTYIVSKKPYYTSDFGNQREAEVQPGHTFSVRENSVVVDDVEDFPLSACHNHSSEEYRGYVSSECVTRLGELGVLTGRVPLASMEKAWYMLRGAEGITWESFMEISKAVEAAK